MTTARAGGSGPPLRIAMIGAKGVPGTVGGVERIVEELGARLAARGHEITVYCRRGYTGADRAPRWRGMRRRWVPALPGKYSETLSHSFASLADALARPDQILHIHSLGNAPLLPFVRLARRGALFHIHGQEWKGGKWGRGAQAYFLRCERMVMRGAPPVVVNSLASRDYYRAAYGRATEYIPNAVDLAEPRPTGILAELDVTPRGFLLFVGRLVPEKGCHLLLEAHRRLGLAVPVVVVGASSHSDDYVEALKRGAGPAVRFAGVVTGDRLTELYSACRLLVNPTARDAVSLVLLEAMGQGACVLASDIPEMVEGVGGAGYHFRSGDVADLAGRLGELLAAPERIEAVRAAAAARVRAVYGWEPVVDAFEAVYRGLLAGRRG